MTRMRGGAVGASEAPKLQVIEGYRAQLLLVSLHPSRPQPPSYCGSHTAAGRCLGLAGRLRVPVILAG